MISGSTKLSILDCNTGSYMYEPIKYIISYDIRNLHQIHNGLIQVKSIKDIEKNKILFAIFAHVLCPVLAL